ncbi:ABC transporter ATP-binding protein [Ectopseudomonas mendocina]|uniref:ABC transporter ATP-binding protein n=1 Tax=Ectopseudomonas mendocina TaxID=300 RepID=A0ABZ2RIB5_ECTME
MSADATHGAREGMPQGMPSRHADRGMWYWALSFARPHWPLFALVLLLSLAVAGAGLAQPYLTKVLIDDGILAGRFDQVILSVACLVGLALLSSLFGGITRYIYVNASARVLHAMRESMLAHLLTLSPDFYARTRQGDIHARLDGDMGELQRFMVDSLLSLVNNGFMLIGSVLMLGWMSSELLVLLLVVLLLNSLFLKCVRPRLETLNRQVRERGSDLAAFFVETLGLVKCVQMFNGQKREVQKLNGLHYDLRETTLRLQVLGYVAGAVPALVMSVSIAGVFLLGGYRIAEGSMTLGTLIAFVTYMQRASGPAQSLMGLYVAYQRARVSLGRVRELSTRQPAVQPPEKADRIVVCGPGELVLQGVSFRYPGATQNILCKLEQHIPAGSRVALRGASGRGKSTLVDLLQRHFDPSEGRIILDGEDLRRHDLDQLRRMVAVVSQDTQLFAASLLDNIRYGRPEASDEEVMKAARAAGVDEFAGSLEEGYQTRLGQRGTLLSGGQRQRVALARVLLMRPRVLVMDESTSGVDTRQEARIHREVDRLFAGQTRIFISHRPLSDEVFDVVIDLDIPQLEEVS